MYNNCFGQPQNIMKTWKGWASGDDLFGWSLMEGPTQTYKNNIRGGNTPMLKLVQGVKKAGFLKTINTKVEDKFFCVGFYLTLYIGSAPKDNLVSFWTLDRPYVAIP